MSLAERSTRGQVVIMYWFLGALIVGAIITGIIGAIRSWLDRRPGGEDAADVSVPGDRLGEDGGTPADGHDVTTRER